ncbi:MAG: MmgE/PrpD family protein [Pseudomonadota bacterium]
MQAPKSNTPTIAETLAGCVTGTRLDDLPPLALERAKMSMASTISSAAMGLDIGSTRIIRELEIEQGGPPQATVWFDGARLPVTGAARANALASDAAASDDSDLRNIAHIGTIVSATALAMAERLDRSGREVLGAMVLGYEVAGRIDEALTPGRTQKGLHSSISTIFGGAVAAGTLLRLDPARMAQAIAISASSIGGLATAADTSWSREYHAGLAATLGVQAALAAQRGFVAEAAILETPRGFFASFGGQALDEVTKDFGQSWDIVTNMAIKLMPGGHPNHAVAEAAAQAAIAGQVDPYAVDRVIVGATQLRDRRNGPTHPTDLIGIAHSMVYIVSAAIADRGFSWEHATAEKVADPRIRVLLDKVAYDPDTGPLPDRFTHHHGGTVTIVMKNGQRFSHTCTAPRGSGPRGVEWADVDAKYRRLVPLSGLAGERIEESLQMIHGLDQLASVPAFTRLLLR